jgi:hypothetical protein
MAAPVVAAAPAAETPAPVIAPVVPATPVAPAAPAVAARPVPAQRVDQDQDEMPADPPTPPAITPRPATSRVMVQGPPPSPNAPVVVVPRHVFERELQSFSALGNQVQLSRAPRGGYMLMAIAPRSFADRIGLVPGDVVLRIDGRPLNGIADASAAYAWIRLTDRFTVDLIRAGRPVQMRFVITGPTTAMR